MTPTDFPTVPPTQVPSATPTEHPTKGAPTSCSYVGPFNSKYGKGNGDEPNARRNCEGNGAPCYVTRHTKPALTVSTRTNGKANNVCKEFCDKTPNCACVVEMDGHHCWLRTANYCSSKESELKSWGGMTTFTKTDPSCTVKSGGQQPPAPWNGTWKHLAGEALCSTTYGCTTRLHSGSESSTQCRALCAANSKCNYYVQTSPGRSQHNQPCTLFDHCNTNFKGWGKASDAKAAGSCYHLWSQQGGGSIWRKGA